MNRLIAGVLIFIISLVMFTVSGILISLNQEPAKCNTEVQDNLNVDITDIRYLTAGISAITLVCSSILIYTDVKT